MSRKIARLRGLERIRGLQEEMERATLEQAVGALVEVESALRHDGEALTDAREKSRAALGAGDRGEWLYADAQSEVARASISRLGALLAQRQAAVVPAMEGFLQCRKQHEQTKVLLGNARSEAALMGTRKTQAEMNEWGVSRWARRARAIVKDS